MGKILAVYGAGGSGKTTFTVNLAESLASKNKVVIVINADLSVGTLQTFFGEKVESNIGIWEALGDRSEMPDKYLKQLTKERNIYLLSCPNESFEVSTGLFDRGDREKLESLIRKLSIQSDYLIIDCTSDLTNAINLIGINKATNLFVTMRSTVNHCLWYKAYQGTLSSLTKGNITNVINTHDMGCDINSFVSAAKIENFEILENVSDAPYYESLGSTIYRSSGKEEARYKATINEIVEKLEE